jgi:hypothetical protein
MPELLESHRNNTYREACPAQFGKAQHGKGITKTVCRELPQYLTELLPASRHASLYQQLSE